MAELHEDEEKTQDALAALQEICQKELEQIKHEVREIDLMINQSQGELNKLAQRNAAATTQIQKMQSQLEQIPRADIRGAYDVSMDAQQRLFMMRGQVEKLQSDKGHLVRYQNILGQVLNGLGAFASAETSKASGAKMGMVETVEMMIQAQEAERQRLSRQMHDGPAQALSNFILQTDIAARWFDLDQAKAKEELTNLKESAATTFQKVRNFIFELRPMMLDDLGLAPTVNRYIENFKGQTGLDVRCLTSGMDERLEPYLEVLVFRAVQELLGNALRHSQATQVKVQIHLVTGMVRVNVEDNGKGFDTATLSQVSGMGLKVIRDRVKMLGGEFEADSHLGQGTRVVFSIPAQLLAHN